MQWHSLSEFLAMGGRGGFVWGAYGTMAALMLVEPLVARFYTLDELTELRRNTLRYARSFPTGDERNQHRQLAVSLRTLFKGEKWLRDHVRNDS